MVRVGCVGFVAGFKHLSTLFHRIDPAHRGRATVFPWCRDPKPYTLSTAPAPCQRLPTRQPYTLSTLRMLLITPDNAADFTPTACSRYNPCTFLTDQKTMKRFLVAAALLVTATSSFAEWTHIATDETQDIYLDKTRVRVEGNLVQLWTLFSFKKDRATKTRSIRSYTSLLQIDCQAEKSRPLSGVLYSGPIASGEVVLSVDTPAAWTNLVPGSIADQLSIKYCQKRK